MTPTYIFNDINTATIYLNLIFQRDNHISIDRWRNIIQDNNDIFNNFTYLIRHLFSLINNCRTCKHFILKGLSDIQRRDIYIELHGFDCLRHLTKHRYTNINNIQCVDLHIDATNFWNIFDYRNGSQNLIYRHYSQQLNSFYQNINYTTAPDDYLIVSFDDFLKFKRLLNSAERSYFNHDLQTSQTRRRLDFNYTNSPQNTICQSSPNNTIKHELADLIFDIKDQLTDSIYKEILEKIALISP